LKYSQFFFKKTDDPAQWLAAEIRYLAGVFFRPIDAPHCTAEVNPEIAQGLTVKIQSFSTEHV